MNYLELLGLSREPFSTSPDPLSYYRAPGHELCLHRLEIAVRLRRGLNVVLGEVGTGKSTLCRCLLRAFAEQPEVTAHLILDPGFASAEAFALHLCELLAGPGGAAGAGARPSAGMMDAGANGGAAAPAFGPTAAHITVTSAPAEAPDGGARVTPGSELRREAVERIQAALLRLTQEQDRIVVLCIDESQKLLPECLEVLRELLNFETNTEKLLQIILFGQRELEGAIAALPNFRDRINEYLPLRPLSRRETIRLGGRPGRGTAVHPARPAGRAPRHRRLPAQDHAPVPPVGHEPADQQPPPGDLARGAGLRQPRRGPGRQAGYRPGGARRPCGQVRAGPVAGRGLCRAGRRAAGRGDAGRGARALRRRPAPAMGIRRRTGGSDRRKPHGWRCGGQLSGQEGAPETGAGTAQDAASGPETRAGTSARPQAATPAPPAGPPVGSSVGPSAAPSATSATGQAAASVAAPPARLGMVGETLLGLLDTVYGRAAAVLDAVMQANPAIANPNRLPSDTILALPALAMEPGMERRGQCALLLESHPTLEEAYRALRARGGGKREVVLAPVWKPDRGLRFYLMPPRFYAKPAEAHAAAERFGQRFPAATVEPAFGDGAVFYRNFD